MIWIISGPTCAGKSNFIQGGGVEQFTGLLSSTPTIFPGNLNRNQDIPMSFFFHYNILRPYRMIAKKWDWNRWFLFLLKFLGLSKDKLLLKQYSTLPSRYQKDLSWQKLLKIKIPKKAIVLVAGKQELLRRMSSRSLFETDFFIPNETRGYPSREWSDFLVNLDLVKVYLDWIMELRHHNIEYLLIDGNDDIYRKIELHDALQIIHNGE